MNHSLREPSPIRWPKLQPWLVAAVVVILYLNTLPNDFVFDDTMLVERMVETTWDNLAEIPFTSRRWVPDLTFALNWLIDGNEPRGYHLVNLLIHALAGVTLYGLVRRTLMYLAASAADLGYSATTRGYSPSPQWFAFTVTLLWVAHPLCTQAVTYVVQRHESMMALFYLLTLYGVVRVAEAQRGQLSKIIPWSIATVMAAAAGMSSKEVMVTAPVVAVLFDRALSRGFRVVFMQRWWLHALIIGTWILIPIHGLRDLTAPEASAGFALEALRWWQYLLSQGEVILWYLRLAVVPWPLVFDYLWVPATMVVQHQPERLWVDIVLPVAAVSMLLLITMLGLVWNTWWGFLGFTFFAVLSVSSSVIPIGDLAVEHRMYLPLTALMMLGSLGAWRLMVRAIPGRAAQVATSAAAVLLLMYGTLTIARNAEYRTSVSIWETVVERAPSNPRGYHNLGEGLQFYGRNEEAIAAYRKRLQFGEHLAADTYGNMARALADLGRHDEAAEAYRRALASNPENPEWQLGLSGSLVQIEDAFSAEIAGRRATELAPSNPRTWNNLGVVFAKTNRHPEAIEAFQTAVELDPTLLDAHRNLVNSLVRSGRMHDAVAAAERSVVEAERAGTDARTLHLMRLAVVDLRQRATQQPR